MSQDRFHCTDRTAGAFVAVACLSAATVHASGTAAWLRRALVLSLALGMMPAVMAERADRDKPTLIEGAKCSTDEIKQISVCTGDVVLIRGTLRITGERMEVRQGPDGWRSATVTAAPGDLATYRQRRDSTRASGEEWFAGRAERIEYDERTEVVRLLQRAQWQRLEDGQPRDEINGQLITYNGLTGTYVVDGSRGAGSDGRVRLILAPRDSGAPAGSAPAAPLTPAPAPGAGKK